MLGIEQEASEVKIIDDFVVEKFKSDEEKLKYYSTMDLQACEMFIQKQEEACHEYLQLCNPFILTPENWQKYADLTSEVRSYILSGFSFRDYVNRQATKEAIKLQIPKHYLEAYSKQLQSQIEEEDSLMLIAILELAKKVDASSKITEDGLSLKDLEEKAPDIYQELKKTAKQYRFQKDVSFGQELDLENVFRRVLLEIEGSKNKEIHNFDIAASGTKGHVINEYYFPQDDELRRWMYLGVKSRILQSDCHHKLVRGQWPVREALLELGESLTAQGQLQHPTEVFNLSLKQISDFLSEEQSDHF